MLQKLAQVFSPKSRPIHTDPFVRRLRCSVIGEGMLPDSNIDLMDMAIQALPAGAVIEIGCYGGLSNNLVCYLLGKYGKSNTLFGCDAWIYEGYTDHMQPKATHIDGRSDISREAYMEHIKQSFIQATRLLSAQRLPHTCHMTSDRFFDAWHQNNEITDVFDRTVKAGGPIAFAYIDGDHSYEAVRKDVENTLAHLVPGGYMLLDDSGDHTRFGSARLAQELKKNETLELVLANPNYLFRRK